MLTIIYSIFQLFSFIYGIREDWIYSQSACIFRTYCYVGLCIAIPISYAIQSISRLFFAVLYKRQYLLSWHIHYYIIIINYLVGILKSIIPMQVDNPYGLEVESHLCVSSSKEFLPSMLVLSISYIIPVSIIIIVYEIIFYYARQSTRRITILIANDGRISFTRPHLKRELILVSILVCNGLPYMILLIWNGLLQQSPPESLYLSAQIIITISLAFKIIVLFRMNKYLKKFHY